MASLRTYLWNLLVSLDHCEKNIEADEGFH